MSHPLVDKIIEEGLSSVNVEMLSPQLRLKLMTMAGDTLLNMNRIEEASDAFAIAGNPQKLRETGEWFKEQQRYDRAALFLRHTGEAQELEELAKECLHRGHTDAAQKIFESLGDEQMVEFIKQNF